MSHGSPVGGPLGGPAIPGPPGNPWERWSWLVPSVFLVFLVFPAIETLQTSSPAWAKALTLALLGLFAGVYMLGYSRWSAHPWRSGLLLCATALGTVPVLGVEAVGLTPFLGAFSALQVPRPWWWWTTGAAAVLPLLSLVGDGTFPLFFFLLVWPLIAVCVLIRLLEESERKHRAASERHAVTSERERVARDVHDVLGHSLTALSIKAELAARLIDDDPERARAELTSIQETARQALAEVRSTVVGLRAGNLEAELDAAPRVLADAGIGTSVEGELSDTDPRHRALLAWVLREAVTNVVRHAGATHVTVTLSPRGLVVADDGRGPTGPEGNGLRGMRERVSAAGGRLELSGGHPGARLEVLLP